MTVRAPRSYGQMCGLALSLDLLGERWTLLILRELARGPKRFGDLAEGLEGIGTNLLSARLKSLEENGLIEKVTLPPPASVAAYDLADRGRDLEPVLEDLALWGFGLFPNGDEGPDLKVKAAWAAMSMKTVMERSDTVAPDGTYAFSVESELFWLRVVDGRAVLRDGLPPFEPDLTAEFGTEGFFGVASGNLTLEQSGVRIEGEDTGRLGTLFQTFRLPTSFSSS